MIICLYVFSPPVFRAYISATLDPHAPEFKANYDESYEKHYGFFRSVVDDVVYDYREMRRPK
jgi:hypothetical protein